MESSPRLDSPVGWYVGSYLLRFVELEAQQNEDPEAEFLAWENTVIVQAANIDEAYGKISAIGIDASEPYLGGDEGVPVQWRFEGITELLPIHEPLGDGAEIMWEEHEAVVLSKLRQRAVSLDALKAQMTRKHE